ncbi:MAG TPA: DUF5668 domain-containing protein, partial [Terriglobales bacterium]|nr:DUF5668 domain-containing protein [Terriglobales bacterium]
RMNCANHSDQAAVAFCRTCGKPLCNQCTRDVRGVIYCESCLAARMEGTQPAPGYVPPQPGYVPPAAGVVPPQTGYQQFMDQGLGLKVAPGPATGPNPAVAGILAGFFPFGVGAVYCSQYAKGLAHLVIMVLLIIGVSSDVPWYVHMVLGIGIGFFYLYQIIDAARTAKAIQMGEPAPDPLGLASMFGSGGGASAEGEKAEGTKIPIAAAVLIALGVLFLINTAFDFSLHRYWPLILIGLGVWMFARQWGLVGGYRPTCMCDRCKTRRLMGPAILITLGVLFLLDEVSTIDFGKTWPAILLVIGVVKLVQSNASYNGHVGPLPPGAPGYPPNMPPPAGVPGTYQNSAPSTSGAVDANASSSSEVKNV